MRAAVLLSILSAVSQAGSFQLDPSSSQNASVGISTRGDDCDPITYKTNFTAFDELQYLGDKNYWQWKDPVLFDCGEFSAQAFPDQDHLFYRWMVVGPLGETQTCADGATHCGPFHGDVTVRTVTVSKYFHVRVIRPVGRASNLKLRYTTEKIAPGKEYVKNLRGYPAKPPATQDQWMFGVGTPVPAGPGLEAVDYVVPAYSRITFRSALNEERPAIHPSLTLTKIPSTNETSAYLTSDIVFDFVNRKPR